MYLFETAFAVFCLTCGVCLAVVWKMLSDIHSESSDCTLKKALSSTGSFIVPEEIRQIYSVDADCRIHEFKNVECQYYCESDSEIHWIEQDKKQARG